MSICKLCPRACGADRYQRRGACGADNKIRIGYIGAHFGEEPVLVGKKGSGTVFFSGCPLKCVFCQNADISKNGNGKLYSEKELEENLFFLAEKYENLNLVTAGHMLDIILPLLTKIKPKIKVPIVYNSSSYETADAIRRLDGIVDIYLPDYKYYSGELSEKYSHARNYRETAVKAIDEMVRQQSKVIIENGTMKKGVIVRHLVLPNCRFDSIKVVKDIAKRYKNNVLISLMSQYTPTFNRSDYPELNRTVTSFEYESVVNTAMDCGLKGFMQQKSSATAALTPKFLTE